MFIKFPNVRKTGVVIAKKADNISNDIGVTFERQSNSVDSPTKLSNTPSDVLLDIIQFTV